mmetsp:Transcript_36606/g.86067  ORF Transcript_36606/g.86067 Transcript_36606/m.86067 type:complete len:328 (-) Transcript_36606:402-1385(-)
MDLKTSSLSSTSTPMMVCTPIFTISSDGRLFTYPPSTRMSPSSQTGGRYPTTVIDARTYFHSDPARWTRTMSEEFAPETEHDTQKKLIHVSLMSAPPRLWRMVWEKLLPENMERRGRVRSRMRPIRLPIPSASSVTPSSMHEVCSFCAYSAPMYAPWLVPPMKSTGIFSSSIARSTPRWARPLAPPPPSTRPMALPAKWRATRSKSSGKETRTWWWRVTGRWSSQRRVRRGGGGASFLPPTPRAPAEGCSSTSSNRALRRPSARAVQTVACSAGRTAGRASWRATRSTASACDTHTWLQALPWRSPWRRMKRKSSSCCTIQELTLLR